MSIWFMSFSSQGRDGAIVGNMVTRKHPLLVQREWRKKEFRDEPTIISWQRLDEYDWETYRADEDDPLYRYVTHALESCYGVLEKGN